MSLPQEQINDANKMQGDGTVFLYDINTGAGHLYLKADNTVTWQGNLYTGSAVQMNDVMQSTDGEKSRPSIIFANPLGVYSPLAVQGSFDNATVTEYRVLRAHLEADQNIYRRRQWKCRLITALNRLSISIQLRESLDGPRFLMPGRQYVPPDFPSVTL